MDSLKKIDRNSLVAIFLSSTLVFFTSASHGVAQTSYRDSDEEGRFSRFQTTSELRQKINALGSSPVTSLRIPILIGVSPSQIYDSWGDARAQGRTHEGTDIPAPRGAFVVSPTDAVVATIGFGDRGGNYVYTYNPGGERFYYAHLDSFAKGLASGQVLKPGDLIGYVGNTGNAAGGPPHLHLGIYKNGAINPFSRLTLEFSLSERVDALARIVQVSADPRTLARTLIVDYRSLFIDAQKASIPLPSVITQAFEDERVAAQVQALSKDMTIGSQGVGVKLVQEFLIKMSAGPVAKSLAQRGITGYFGEVTKFALAEYQTIVVIRPASGNFGPETRAHLVDLITRGVVRLETVIPIPAGGIPPAPSGTLTRDLSLGSRGEDVKLLQALLIQKNKGPAALSLANAGATGYFGSITLAALIEYQKAVGLPATGYFGPLTRASLQ